MNSGKLRDIFVDLFEDEAFQLNPETHLKYIKNWDSLNLISLAIGIEKAFKVKLSAVDINSIQTIADILAILELKGIAIASPV